MFENTPLFSRVLLKGRSIVTTSNTHMEQALAFAARRGGLAFKRDLKILDLSPDDGPGPVGSVGNCSLD
jgi:hypothetical protein